MESSGFVKLPRSLLNEDWAKDAAVLSVFVHLLLKANYEEGEYYGCTIPRGAAVTSHRGLAKECGITPSAARTALKTLAAHQVTQSSARQSKQQGAQQGAHPCTIVTLCNYDNYSGKAPNKRAPQNAPQNAEYAHPGAQEGALSKEIYKEYEEIYKEVFGEDNSFLQPLEEWMEYKKEKGQTYKGRKGITQFCNRLKKLSGGKPDRAMEIVNYAMAANYATIFPPKDPGQPAKAKVGNSRICIPTTPENEISTI